MNPAKAPCDPPAESKKENRVARYFPERLHFPTHHHCPQSSARLCRRPCGSLNWDPHAGEINVEKAALVGGQTCEIVCARDSRNRNLIVATSFWRT